MENQTQLGSWLVIWGCDYHGNQPGGCPCGVAGCRTDRGTLAEYKDIREKFGTDGIGDFVPDQPPISTPEAD